MHRARDDFRTLVREHARAGEKASGWEFPVKGDNNVRDLLEVFLESARNEILIIADHVTMMRYASDPFPRVARNFLAQSSTCRLRVCTQAFSALHLFGRELSNSDYGRLEELNLADIEEKQFVDIALVDRRRAWLGMMREGAPGTGETYGYATFDLSSVDAATTALWKIFGLAPDAWEALVGERSVAA